MIIQPSFLVNKKVCVYIYFCVCVYRCMFMCVLWVCVDHVCECLWRPENLRVL